MLIEIAVGDAYGAGFEFTSEEIIEKENTLDKYYGSRIDDLKAGQYTDDTQMTLAIVELMLSDEDWTEENIVKYFLRSFKRDQRKGYSKGFYNFLLDTDTTEDFINNINNDSVRNGAAMRSVPIGLFSTIEEVMDKAKTQAKTTHDSHEGIVSAQAVALMAYYFRNKIGDKHGLKKFIEFHTKELFVEDYSKRVPCDAIETIDAVLTVLKKSSSLKEILDRSVKLGGDTDSVASIALGVGCFSNEYKLDLPSFLFEDLENETYGRDYLLKLEKTIALKFK